MMLLAVLSQHTDASSLLLFNVLLLPPFDILSAISQSIYEMKRHSCMLQLLLTTHHLFTDTLLARSLLLLSIQLCCYDIKLDDVSRIRSEIHFTKKGAIRRFHRQIAKKLNTLPTIIAKSRFFSFLLVKSSFCLFLLVESPFLLFLLVKSSFCLFALCKNGEKLNVPSFSKYVSGLNRCKQQV